MRAPTHSLLIDTVTASPGFVHLRPAFFQVLSFAPESAMRELNPLYNQIKDLKGRDESLRGYL